MTAYTSVVVVSDDLRLRGPVKWTKYIDILSSLPRSRVCDTCDSVTLARSTVQSGLIRGTTRSSTFAQRLFHTSPQLSTTRTGQPTDVSPLQPRTDLASIYVKHNDLQG
jgi:hypothetical protein